MTRFLISGSAMFYKPDDANTSISAALTNNYNNFVTIKQKKITPNVLNDFFIIIIDLPWLCILHYQG